EPDPKSAAQARESGLDVRTGLLEPDIWPSGHFDAITMNHVIEHLHTPIGILRICAELLKPGGQISIATPNFDSRCHQIFGRHWFGLQAPTHLSIFTPKSLRQMLEATGFQPRPMPDLEPAATEMCRRSMHIRTGGDPVREDPPL